MSIKEKYLYKAFGLSICSELPFQELSLSNKDENYIDIEVKTVRLPQIYEHLPNNKFSYLVKENQVFYRFRNFVGITIKNGNQILVTPLKNYDDRIARLVILGSGFGALLMQRRILPIHGSAIAIDGKAYAVVGDSGAGKSTLASVFLKRGYKILTDDVIAISFNNNKPYVIPSYPQQKLWENSLNKFNMDSSNYQSLYQRETKYAVPLLSNFYQEALPLAGIFELVISSDEQIQLKSYDGLERFNVLFDHTYRNFLIPQLGLQEWHFIQSTRIINDVGMYKLTRPLSSFTALELSNKILNTIFGVEDNANNYTFAK